MVQQREAQVASPIILMKADSDALRCRILEPVTSESQDLEAMDEQVPAPKPQCAWLGRYLPLQENNTE